MSVCVCVRGAAALGWETDLVVLGLAVCQDDPVHPLLLLSFPALSLSLSIIAFTLPLIFHFAAASLSCPLSLSVFLSVFFLSFFLYC